MFSAQLRNFPPELLGHSFLRWFSPAPAAPEASCAAGKPARQRV
jgi:hypothetical protein